VRVTLAALLLGGLGFALVDALPLRGLDWLEILPLHLCDLAVLLAVVALLTRNRTATEILYFWGLTGTLIATITPDVDRGFPDTRCLSFFALHGAVAIAAVVMVFGAGVRPGRNAVWRVFGITNGYAALVAVVDFAADKNFLYLRVSSERHRLTIQMRKYSPARPVKAKRCVRSTCVSPVPVSMCLRRSPPRPSLTRPRSSAPSRAGTRSPDRPGRRH
jgi:hypothetical integral membrane protein (TIGR02206 family)